jgi:hypothetical protein
MTQCSLTFEIKELVKTLTCTIDRRESTPFILEEMGTPITGRIVNEATIPAIKQLGISSVNNNKW